MAPGRSARRAGRLQVSRDACIGFAPDRRTRDEMKWSVGYFGVKDLFTIVNLLGGVFGIYYAMTGRPDWAGYAIFAGYLFGDSLDGQVARATKTGNRFGAEFDSASDHVGQGIAPALVVYSAYARDGYATLGLTLMAVLITTATIRNARFTTASFNFPLCYAGLPRTVSGLVALSLPNSGFMDPIRPWTYWVGSAVILMVAVLNLVPIPYMTHKGKRKMQTYVKVAVFIFVGAPVFIFIFARPYLYLFIFGITFGYSIAAWIPILPDERKAFYAEYRRWAHEVATLK
jgi:phosphatidylserine synthase